jgi:hypothetical protein
MAQIRFRILATIALALFGAGAGQILAAQPDNAPAPRIRTFAERAAPHPYKSALGSLWNYHSCGYRMRPAIYEALAAELRSTEARAAAKGLGPLLEQLRSDYQDLLAHSDMLVCAWGPARALTGARVTIAAFRTWVARQPAR